ncbi:MAG TPA: HD domain-containing protein [Dehalococcoidia bacterium]|nr:HD domain-containing protein [Dehalococcoidia bacterium]
MSLARPLYRTRQFLGALRPRVSAAELEDAKRFLGPQLFALFSSMMLRDQRHSLDVFRLLDDQGCHDNDVLAAALLHDVGKGRVRLWERVVYVLAGALARPLQSRLGNGAKRLRDHAAIGAVQVAAAGASPQLVRLVAEHEDRQLSPSDAPLRLLRSADDSC